MSASSGAAARPVVYADQDCPFAHRILALFAHAGIACDRHETPLGEKPAGLLRWSRSGRLPLVVFGEVPVGESRVVLEYVAERYGLPEALPSELAARTLHREAMALVDAWLAPPLFRPRQVVDARLEETLDVLSAATGVGGDAPLLLFHVAPLWQRYAWWRPDAPVTRAIRDRAGLMRWLDAAVAHPAMRATAVGRDESVSGFARLAQARWPDGSD